METLEGLFKWHHELNLVDSLGDNVKKQDGTDWVVYQRVIGDSEINLARETALRASAIQRRKLQEPSNLDRMLIIPDYHNMDKGNIIALIILHELPDLRAAAQKEVLLPFPDASDSSATLKQQEETQTAIDTYFEKRDRLILEKINELVQARQEELQKNPKKRLQVIHADAAMNGSCREIFLVTLNEMLTYLGTWLDSEFKHRAFQSYNSFRNASTHLKQQLIEGYAVLELGGNKLKKSPEVE